jgi:hypothetical protein
MAQWLFIDKPQSEARQTGPFIYLPAIVMFLVRQAINRLFNAFPEVHRTDLSTMTADARHRNQTSRSGCPVYNGPIRGVLDINVAFRQTPHSSGPI